VAAAGLLPLLAIFWVTVGGQKLAAVGYFKFTLVAIFYFCLIGYLITQKSNQHLLSFLNHRSLKATGKISYGMYVFHPLCFGLVSRFNRPHNFWIEVVASFFVTYLVASLSYRYYERPFLNLKSHFSNAAQNLY
jgi:peptidoglycan/LPS O-acetylase OafA/YrhL